MRKLFKVYSIALLPALLGLGVSACTPEIREYRAKQWKDMKEYKYSEAFEVFGLKEVFPTYRDQLTEHKRVACMHKDTQLRVVMMEGANDEIYYKHCTVQPLPDEKPQRFEGR